MKQLILIGLMLLTSGCNADDQPDIAQLKADIAKKEAELKRAQDSGGYPTRNPPIVCINGVMYYITRTYGGSEVYSVAYFAHNNYPQQCSQ